MMVIIAVRLSCSPDSWAIDYLLRLRMAFGVGQGAPAKPEARFRSRRSASSVVSLPPAAHKAFAAEIRLQFPRNAQYPAAGSCPGLHVPFEVTVKLRKAIVR